MTDSFISIGQLDVPYKLVRSASTNKLKLTMTMDDLRVTAPENASDTEIRQALTKKRKWIVENLAALRQHYEKTHKIARFRTGAKIPYCGRLAKIVTHKAQTPFAVVCYRNGFHVEHPQYETIAEHDDAVESAIQQYLRQRFHKEAGKWLKDYQRKLDVGISQLRITNMTRRWGSCSRNGTVSLDWHLVYAPKRVARYVIAHELAHVRVKEHNTEFWKTVRRIFGEHEHEHTWLLQNEHLLGYNRLNIETVKQR